MSSIYLNIYRILSTFNTILTAFTNLLLIILTSWYIKRKFGTYRCLLIIFSALGIVYDAVGFLISPMVHSFENGFIYFTLLQSKMIPISNLLALSASIFFSSTSMLAVMFIHRYFSVAKPEQLFYFQGKRLTLWLIYISFFGVACFIGLFYLCEVDYFTKLYANNEFVNSYGTNIADLAVFQFLIFDTSYRWKPVSLIIFVSLTMILQNAIIIFCGFKIRFKLYNEKCKYSPVLYKLHQQFFKTLVLQVTIPTFLIFVPVFSILYAPFFGLKLSVVSTNAFCLFSFYPAVDSIIVMYVITDYKFALRDFLKDISKIVYSPFNSLIKLILK